MTIATVPALRKLDLVVLGRPKTKGSTRSFVNQAGKLSTQGSTPESAAWQDRIYLEAREKWDGNPTDQPVTVTAAFYFDRPKSHFVKSGLRPTAPAFPTSRSAGDIDKLCRAVLDALTGVVFADDSQVVYLAARKLYTINGCPPGVTLHVSEGE